jgi:two-component system sensor histidine kinase KdpD
MASIIFHKLNKPVQYFICIFAILAVSAICYSLSQFIGYRIVALILLVSVSLLAMFFDIFPVMLASLLSALVWDFFFIPKKFTFYIDNAEDGLMLLMYFIIALVNAVLTFKIRQVEKEANKKEEKENMLKLYNTLLNSLSHELRTPIATIIGATDNLQTVSNKLSDEQKNMLITEISTASFRLNKQVENLLNMSRIESGYIRPRKDWCDVEELIYGVVNHIKENTITQLIEISIADNMPLVFIDFGLIHQVLYNIINNAVIYTPANTTIQIKAGYSKKVNGHFNLPLNNVVRDSEIDILVITIADNGKGFPQNEIKKVFDKFYRLKNTETGGTGLGLSIAKGFVEAHYGNIELENIATGGAKFKIEIPTKTNYLNNLKNE